MSQALPAITGKQLIRLLRRDGWTEVRRVRHGIAFTKAGPGERQRITIVPGKRSVLPSGTLAAILSPKQSGIGREGLAALLAQHGLK